MIERASSHLHDAISDKQKRAMVGIAKAAFLRYNNRSHPVDAIALFNSATAVALTASCTLAVNWR